MNITKSPYFFIPTLVSILLLSSWAYASKPQKLSSPKSAAQEWALYFDPQGEQAFVLKQRRIQNKPEYFLAFKRGKQTYSSTLITKKQFDQYKKVIDKNFRTSKRKSRQLASLTDSCHRQVGYQTPYQDNYVPTCWSHLPAASQKNIRQIISNMNKKLYGVAGHDLI